MLQANPFHRKCAGQRTPLRPLVIILGLAALAILTTYTTWGQLRVSTGGAPRGATPYGAATSIRYGPSQGIGGRSRLLPSEERYLKSARGLLPSEERYRRHSPGLLPSEGRYGYITSGIDGQKSLAPQVQSNIYRGMGTIRYGGQPVRMSIPVQPTIPSTVTARPRVYTPAVSPKAYVPGKAYSAPESIRYGAARTSFSPKPTFQAKTPSPPAKGPFYYSPKSAITTGSTTANANISKLAYSGSSIRYGKTVNIMPMATRKPPITKSKAPPPTKQPKTKASQTHPDRELPKK